MNAIPRHICMILDGNGRWATAQGVDRSVGHAKGVSRMRPVIEQGAKRGVEVMTFFLFSTENWRRPQAEVDALMHLCVAFLDENLAWMKGANFVFTHIGRRAPIPQFVLEQLDHATAMTAGNTGMRIQLAFNYGARTEMVDATRRIAEKVKAGELAPEAITEQTLSDHLYTAGVIDPDLWIRTAGEMRLSNFLLWQISYAELHVTPTLCPDFTPDSLDEAIAAYGRRTRKFGQVK